jgi:hypothetical protein
MSFGPAIDDAIGLVLVYLMLSILVTTISEAIASILNKRGKDLYAALINLTDGIVYALPAPAPGGVTTAPVADHPLIQNNTPGVRLPSYVSPRNFALAVLDGLGGLNPAATMGDIQTQIGQIASPVVRQTLLAFANKAGANVASFQSDLEGWFNDAMDRLSGDYKRWSQGIGMAIALATAIAFNANTFSIVNTLWTDSHVREAMVGAASKQAAPAAGCANDCLHQLDQNVKDVSDLAVPIGWSGKDSSVAPFVGWLRTLFHLNRGKHLAFGWDMPAIGAFVLALIGWAFTGVAVSLGAPFWFDTLQKLVNVRSTGPKPGSKTSASAASAAGTAPS